MKEITLVFIGGGAGSVAWFLIGRFINARYTSLFPWATLGVNIVASLVLGYTMAMFTKKPEGLQWIVLLLGAGFCGGLSTFSTFSFENFTLLQKGETGLFITYTLVSFVVCLGGIAVGYLSVGK